MTSNQPRILAANREVAADMTLADFLLARIAEDEARVERPDGDGPLNSWHTRICAVHPQGLEDTWCDCTVPARVLAECAAKRAIVALVIDLDAHGSPYTEGVRDAVCALAAVYDEHPDYRDEWRA